MEASIGNFTGHVNGDLTGCRPRNLRSRYRAMLNQPDLATILERVERRLKALGLAADAASKAAGKPDAIRNLRRAVGEGGARGINLNTLAALAPILKTTTSWLSDGVGPEDPSAEENTIPVWGKAGAGGAVFRFHEVDGPIDRIRALDDANDRTAAVEIDGESLGPLFDRWYAIYDEVRDPPTSDLLGALCIVETADGRVYIKQLTKGRGKRFTLKSNYDPPVYDVEVRWAARVKHMVAR